MHLSIFSLAWRKQKNLPIFLTPRLFLGNLYRHLSGIEVSRLHGGLQARQRLKPFCFLQPVISVHGLPPGLNESFAGLNTCTSAINKKASPELLLFQRGFCLRRWQGNAFKRPEGGETGRPLGTLFQGAAIEHPANMLDLFDFLWRARRDSNPRPTA